MDFCIQLHVCGLVCGHTATLQLPGLQAGSGLDLEVRTTYPDTSTEAIFFGATKPKNPNLTKIGTNDLGTTIQSADEIYLHGATTAL